MNIKSATILTTLAFTALVGCATPQHGPAFDDASRMIRAAQMAGAAEHAPQQYRLANETYSKAEAMQSKRRTDRAQKLLELASAQASLAKAMSDAASAERSLGFAQSVRSR